MDDMVVTIWQLSAGETAGWKQLSATYTMPISGLHTFTLAVSSEGIRDKEFFMRIFLRSRLLAGRKEGRFVVRRWSVGGCRVARRGMVGWWQIMLTSDPRIEFHGRNSSVDFFQIAAHDLNEAYPYILV